MEQQFQENWNNLVEQFNLEDKDWATTLYSRRTLWVEKFKRGKFYAWMTTTQRNEGINVTL